MTATTAITVIPGAVQHIGSYFRAAYKNILYRRRVKIKSPFTFEQLCLFTTWVCSEDTTVPTAAKCTGPEQVWALFSPLQ